MVSFCFLQGIAHPLRCLKDLTLEGSGDERWPGPDPIPGAGGLYNSLQFKVCTKTLYAIWSVFLRICAGTRPESTRK